VRKGRLELWLGLGCVLLLAALAFGGYYHKNLQAQWYRWRFLYGEKSDCKEALGKLAELDPESDRYFRDLYVENPEDLQVVKRLSNKLTVRNDRGHRVYVGRPPGQDMTALALLAIAPGPGWPSDPQQRQARDKAVNFLMQRCDGSKTYVPAMSVNASEDAVRAALRWLAQHQESAAWTSRMVLDPGETAEFWTWPSAGETPPQ